MSKMAERIDNFEAVQDRIADRSYQLGRRKYILFYGVLIWGGVIFAIMQAVDFLSHGLDLEGKWLATWLVVSLALSCSFGYLFGWLRWRGIVRRMKR
jgi:hypothetical protein